jgi:hypothetical protein
LNFWDENCIFLNQKHLLIGCAAPRICYHRHLSEVRDVFRAPANFTPGIGGRVTATADPAYFRQDKDLFVFQGIEQRFPRRLIHRIFTMLTELYRLPDFTKKSAYACLA